MWDIVLGAALVVVTGLFVYFVYKDISNHEDYIAYRNKIDTFKIMDEFEVHFEKYQMDYHTITSRILSGKNVDYSSMHVTTLITQLDNIAIKYYNLNLNLDVIDDYHVLSLFQIFNDKNLKKFIDDQRKLYQIDVWKNAEKLYEELKSLNKIKSL